MTLRPAAGAAVLAAAVAVAACWIEPAERAEQERTGVGPGLEARVRAMLDSSAAGWNGGDLETFMSVYLPTARTTYVGGGGVRVGYEAIRRRYAPLFTGGADRDSLRFEDLRVRSIADDVAVGVATWVLHDTTGVTGSGPFTLVLRRADGGWRIVHDHSSSWPGEENPSEQADPSGEASPPGDENPTGEARPAGAPSPAAGGTGGGTGGGAAGGGGAADDGEGGGAP